MQGAESIVSEGELEEMALSGPSARAEVAPEPCPEFFTHAEWNTIEALCARILPATDRPGAREAQVVRFIDHMLTAQYASQQAFYREALVRLNRFCVSEFGREFLRLDNHEQDSVLSQLEADRVPGWTSAAEFFELVRMHTIEGQLSDPKYGGNSNGMGWAGLL